MAEQIEVSDVVFVTPARVKLVVNGEPTEVNVGIDFINRQVFQENSMITSDLSDLVFAYLDRINGLPEEFFQAPPDIYQQVVEAKADHDLLNTKEFPDV